MSTPELPKGFHSIIQADDGQIFIGNSNIKGKTRLMVRDSEAEVLLIISDDERTALLIALTETPLTPPP